MRSIVKAFVVVALVVGPATVSLALPPRAALGSSRCLCTCQGDLGSKTLEWVKNLTCNSSGKPCKYTNDGGKTWSTGGKLNNCSDCTYGSTGWSCNPAGGQALKSRVPTTGTLKQTTPPIQQPSRITPPAAGATPQR